VKPAHDFSTPHSHKKAIFKACSLENRRTISTGVAR
jgi:hypothetical protein